MSLLVRLGGLIFKSNKVIHLENTLSPKANKRVSCFFSKRYFTDFQTKYKSFDESVNDRRFQAKRSILVQVNSDLSFPELHSYCSQFGNILGVHHYTLQCGQQHFMLVEFETEEDASRVISSGCFANETDVIPVKSPFLWFRSPKDKTSKRILTDIFNGSVNPINMNLLVKNGCRIPEDSHVLNAIGKTNSLSDQMTMLHEITRLDDLGIRLRYMVARQIESALVGLYPDATVRPFGSSVNGFGKMGCDLDLLLRFSSNEIENDPHSRLVFHTKRSTASGRMQQQKYMEVIGDIVQLFLPGCSHVRRILQARIPIIKYNQEYAGVECDLSMASMSGVYMTELMYIYGSLDSRVRPLVFTVRKWAQSIGITNPSPGRWITNFPLTMMVLFFLQNANDGPILPSYNYLKKTAGKNDCRFTEDHINCTFSRDISKIKCSSQNNNSLEQLLLQFFEFYASFDFNSNALSINEGRSINKPDHSALYIVNPLEGTLNVSKNVSYEECERLRIEVRNAAWQLESLENNKGLESIFKPWNSKEKLKINPRSKISTPRMVSVEDLFIENEATLKATKVIDDSLHKVVLRDETVEDLKNEILDMAQKNKQHLHPEIKEQIKEIRVNSENEKRKMQRLLHLTDKDVNHRNNLRRKSRRR